MNMRVERFDIDGIEVGDRLRPLSPERVAALASSIRELGLRTPLTVIARPMEDFDTKVILVTGHHRLAALKEIGEDRADCFVIPDDEIDAKLWEIDENLMRASLSPAEEAKHLKLRKELWEARRARDERCASCAPLTGGDEAVAKTTAGTSCPTTLGNSETTCPENRGRGRPSQFAAETAKATGDDKRTINRKIARGEKVIDEVLDMIKGTKLDTGVYLDKLKGLPPNDQVHAARRDLAIERQKAKATKPASKPVAPAAPPEPTPAERQTAAYGSFMALVSEIGLLTAADIVAGRPLRDRAKFRQHMAGVQALLDALEEAGA